MIEEIAAVVAIEQGIITVESTVKSACGSCQQLEHCGSGQIAKALPQRKLTTQLATKLPVAVGDQVMLGISQQHLLRSAWQVYCWPLIGLISAAALGQWLVMQQVFAHELIAILLSFAGGYAGFALARYWQNSVQSSRSLTPRILRIVTKKISVTEIPQDN